MPSLDLITGEAVALDLRPAALPSRLVAGAIDALLQAALLGALAVLAVASGTGTSSAGEAALTLVVLLAVLAGYPIAFESLLRGRTPGKAAMGLRVVRDDGGPVGFRQALVRGLTSTFVERPGITVFTGAVICMLLNDRSKRIGDLLAGTVVLQERVSTSIGPGTAAPPQLAAWASELDLAGLPDDLALSARSYLARAGELTEAARGELGGRLASAVAAVVTPPSPQGTPAWAYLSAVLAERSRRAAAGLAATGLDGTVLGGIGPGGPGLAGIGKGGTGPAGTGRAAADALPEVSGHFADRIGTEHASRSPAGADSVSAVRPDDRDLPPGASPPPSTTGFAPPA